MPHFDVFLSYSSVDRVWTEKLKDDLGRYGVTVWLDKDKIRPGDMFVGALEQALKESLVVALIVSPDSVASGWVEEEYHRALQLTKDKLPLRLIPVVLRDAELPGFLQIRQPVDFRNPSEYSLKIAELVWGIKGEKPTDVLDLSAPEPSVDAISEDIEVLEKCFRHAAGYIGFGYEELHFTLKVFDDGSAQLIRTVKMQAYETVEKLDQYLMVPTSRRPDVFAVADVEVLHSSNPLTILSLDDSSRAVAQTEQKILLLNITPPLKMGDIIEFETTERIRPGTIALLYDQLEKGKKDNTLALDVSWPTKKLFLEVFLPDKFRLVKAQPDVWRGPSDISVEKVSKEMLRMLSTRLEQQHNQRYFKVWLEINYPRQGYTYVLRWTPPHRERL